MRKEIPLEQVSVGNLSMLENKMKKTQKLILKTDLPLFVLMDINDLRIFVEDAFSTKLSSSQDARFSLTTPHSASHFLSERRKQSNMIKALSLLLLQVAFLFTLSEAKSSIIQPEPAKDFNISQIQVNTTIGKLANFRLI